jgi:3-oxoacyl-[acyl-carrier-protein] synthase II
MTVATAVRPLAVTGIGVVSPAGLGQARLDEAVRTGRITPSGTAPALGTGPLPPGSLHRLPDLRLADHLGRKGLRNIDRLTAIGLIATQQALANAGPGSASRSRTGVVVGTSTGSVVSLAELAHDTLTQDRPYLVNPVQFTNNVMNACAAQIAIWNELSGLNATVAGGQLASIFALRCARVLLDRGRADRLVVGGVEETSEHTAWAWHRTGALAPGTALGEGGAMAVLDSTVDPDDPRVQAELLACEVSFSTTDRAAALADCITRALARSVADTGSVALVALGSTGYRRLDEVERRGLKMALGRSPQVVDVAGTLGVTHSASGALQLAALLGAWSNESNESNDDAGGGSVGLLTAVGPDGNVGCAVLRRA